MDLCKSWKDACASAWVFACISSINSSEISFSVDWFVCLTNSIISSLPLTEDNKFFVMSLQTEIRGVHLTDGYYNVIPALTIPRVANASSVDHDVREQRLYWTDVQRKSINRAFINGSDIETVIEGRCWKFMHMCNIVSNKWSWSRSNTVGVYQVILKYLYVMSF